MKKNYASNKYKSGLTPLFYIVLIGTLFFNWNGFSQGATCLLATPISINGACASGTISDTSQDAPLIGTCAGTFNREGWYTFNVPSGPTNVTVTGIGNNRNIYLQLISSTSSCAGLTQVSCANATTTNGTQTETLTATLNTGTYYIKVVNVGSNGNLTLTSLCVTTAAAPPTNATCATATTLPCATTNLAGTTVGTTSIANGTGCSMGDYGVWYKFVGDGNNTTISSTAAAGFDHEMSISYGSCGSLTSLSCNDSALSGGTETTTFTTVNGTTYYVYISHYSNGSTTTGAFTITRTCSAPPVAPPNATCATATALPCSTTNLAGTTVGTSSIANGTGCSMGDYGVWYTFVGDGYSTTISSTAGAGFDHEMAIASGSCGSLTSISCNDSGLSGGTESYTFTTTIGTTYFVYISHYSNGSTTTGTFTISRTCVTCGVPTMNAVTAITSTTATISWTPPTIAPSNGYQYYVSTSSATPSGAGTATALTSINLTGLSPNTTYYVFVRSDCGSSNFSTWSPYVSFTTGYCPSTSTSSTYYITNFATTGGSTNITNNASGYSAGGYGNFTAMSVTQMNNGTINFTANFYDGFYTYGFNIWVDWNDDLDFNDAGEKVYASGGYVSSASGSFVVPSGAAAGSHRMRIVANYFSTDPSACGSISSGETEDYTVIVTPALCPGIPTSIVISAITQTSATLSWTASSPAPANGYQYYVTTSATPPSGSTVPTGSTAAGVTTVNLSGLSADTTYYVYVRNNCNGVDFSSWTVATTFVTGYCVSTSTSSTYYINQFSTTGGIANITNNASGYSAGGYGNFTGLIVSQLNFGTINFSAVFYDGFYSYGFNIWVDWNDDLDFNDAGELVYASGAYVTSASGSFTVPGTAAVGNHRMRIRANYLSTNPSACGTISSGETEDYTVTVLNPLPCSANPTLVSVTMTSQTTATVNWAAASPAPANGYQYYLSTSNSTPSLSAIPTGTTGPGITTIALTGLTSATTYYVWVRSDCGGATGQGIWIGPVTFTQPNCALGSGVGTSAAGCPTVLAGGLGLNGADPTPINTCVASGCVDLEANHLQLGQTTNYTVQSIPYNPPYQYNCLQNHVSVNVDDVWSSSINLPFNFCFYGNSYNQCLIGSNGVITFDQTTNTPGGYSTWSFNTNLPNNTLFLNTIFGVYHDIDPSVGGDIGWELITLNTGCRALVASWNNIPMFSSTCNSQLYTGMIVLYENTNIIEVYVKEKNVCSTWNSGNAIIGLQNATGSQAVVAPNRNGLDPDWTITTGSSEAWRFIPSGPSITTITWHEGSGTTGPIVGTGPTINVCPASTTTYTAEVMYTLCTGGTMKETDETTVTVNGNKVWNGSVDTDWNKANNWTPVGIPNGSDCVVIPMTSNSPIVSGTGYNGLAGTLSVLDYATLTVSPSSNLTVTNWVNVHTFGTFQLENTSNLVQINNVANTGNIIYKRNASVKNFDYVYWSSPVANFNVSNITSPLASGPIYRWNPTVANPNGGQGNWESAAGNTMTAAKGYIVRVPSGFSSSVASTLYGSFTGVPNNGPYTFQISRGTDTNTAYHQGLNGTEINNFSDNWNLVGNPYPSSIRGSQFLFDNNTKIEGNIKLWTHGTQPSVVSSPFYNTFIYNYSPGDYLTYNFTGTSCCPAFGADIFIGAGQGFFVQMKDGPAATDNISFNNALRSYTYDNSAFYKMSNATTSANNIVNLERNRIWIDLINSNQMSDRTLFGYIQGATMESDSFFDSKTLDTGAMSVYSLIGNEKYLIQGRSLPFNVNDEVPMGMHIPTAGNYSIALASVDGLFTTQNIYLRDKLLNVTHDLKSSPYHFNTTAGNINDRFKVVYLNGALNNASNDYNNNIKVTTNENVSVYSTKEQIKSIIVYNVLGQKLKEYTNINANNFSLAGLQKNNTTLLLEIQLDNDTKTTEKVIY